MILHQVTDGDARVASPVSIDRLVAQADLAAAAGLDVFQLREPALEAGALTRIARSIVSRFRGSRTKLVVNDRVDVAIAAGADGVHLKEGSLRPRDVRTFAPPGLLIGASVHSVTAAQAAEGADYLIAGTVWPTASKPDHKELLGPAGLRAVAAAVHIPVLAIGGVTADRIQEVAMSGAQGIAAIGLFQVADSRNAGSLRELARDLRMRFDTRGGGSYH